MSTATIPYEGTVVYVNVPKGYGFIHVAARSSDLQRVFFHVRDVAGSLDFDQTLIERRVVFNVVQGDRGPMAQNVRPAH